jgi:hypothetical protein
MRLFAGCSPQHLPSLERVDRAPLREGDFVWCVFPERENPARPGPLHLAYTLAVSGAATPAASHEFSALTAYTTSQPRPHPALPPGVFVFDQQTAASFGQGRAFVMDLRRLALVPVTPEWFPRLDQPGNGIQGRVPKRQERQPWRVAEDLLTRRSEIVERLGPLWPGGRR